MPRIFISYRRADSETITGRIHDRLVGEFGAENVFLDVEPGHIPEGEDFRRILQNAVSRCDVELVIIGTKWLDIRENDKPDVRRLDNPDDFVRIEVKAGLDRKETQGTLVIPVLVMGAGMPASKDLPDDLQPLTFLNARQVRGNPDFHNDMTELIKRIHAVYPDRRFNPTALFIGIAAALVVIVGFIALAAAGVIPLPRAATPTFDPIEAANRLLTLTKEAEIAALATPTSDDTATIEAILTNFATQTQVAQTATAAAYTDTPTVTPLPSATPTETNTFAPTPTATINSQATQDFLGTRAALNTLATANAQATNDALAVQNAPTNTAQPTPTITSTATVTATTTPTPVPTATAVPTSTATVTATQTSTATPTQDATAIAQAIQNAQATLQAEIQATQAAAPPPLIGVIDSIEKANIRTGPGTQNPVIETLSSGVLVTVLELVGDGAWVHIQLADGRDGYISSGLLDTVGTATPVPTLNPAALSLAAGGITTNNAWSPVIKSFNGVEMVLVPAGCFQMGSQDGFDDEQPVNPQCFDQPFWLDRTEVTNAQFASFGGVAANPGRRTDPNRPRERITWFEARDYCVLRGGRLPTEREWEYAARGPDNLIYPWGNNFIADNVVYFGNSNNQTANVGSRPSGASWVGALDMSGNVWEWTASVYQAYPYGAGDGRETDSNSTDVARAVRGGSFYGFGLNFRASYRVGFTPVIFYDDVGFRCLLSYP